MFLEDLETIAFSSCSPHILLYTNYIVSSEERKHFIVQLYIHTTKISLCPGHPSLHWTCMCTHQAFWYQFIFYFVIQLVAVGFTKRQLCYST